MSESSSDLSELEFFSVDSEGSLYASDSDIISYKSVDETVSVLTNESSMLEDSCMKSSDPTKVGSVNKHGCEQPYPNPINPASALSNLSFPTNEDVLSSQIFEGWDSPTKYDDTKLRFNECVQFFSALSLKNKKNEFCKVDTNNKQKYQARPNQSLNESTCAHVHTTINVSVQTDDHTNEVQCSKVFDDDTLTDDYLHDNHSKDVVSTDGDLSNAVIATATCVASLLNDDGHCKFSSKSSVDSDNSGVAAIKASTRATSVVLSAIDRKYSHLLGTGHLVINLSTTCVIRQTVPSNSSNSLGTHNQSGVTNSCIVDKAYSSLVSLPRISHISNSSTNSSSTDDSVPEISRIFVATPFTITSIMTEESHPIPSINTSSFTQLNGSNHNPVTPDIMKSEACKIDEQNIEYSKILQNTFFRTSTPILGVNFKRKCIPNNDLFLASSFVKSKSFKELNPKRFGNIYFSKSFDYRRQNQAHTVNHDVAKLSDKRAFLSLYNLTCFPGLGTKELSPQSNNPTNIFFTNSQSYISLKETDIDTGREMPRPIYKETNLDNRSLIQKGNNLKAKSLSNICKVSNENSLILCDNLDENILNKCPSSASLSVNTSLLYAHLRDKATTPAQIRVAKSITKLNLPEWMNPVEFIEKRSSNNPIIFSQLNHEIMKSKNDCRLQMVAKKVRPITPPKPSPEKIGNLNFSLPSAKYQGTSTKLKPIAVSRARQALNQSKTINENNNNAASIIDLSKEFLSHLTSNDGGVKDKAALSTKDSIICSRAHCSKEIRSVNIKSDTCEQCSEKYCSFKCLTGDRKVHLLVCNLNAIKRRLTSLLSNLNKAQILVLAKMFEIGQRQLGKGFILWNVDNHMEKKTTPICLPKYVSVTEAQKLDIFAKLNELDELHFLFVLSSTDSVSNSVVVLSKCYRRHFVVTDHQYSNPARICKNSSLSREEREKLFNRIVSLLHNYNIDIQEKCPAIYFKLVEYVMSGCCFAKQVITISDPDSMSPLQLIIEPDQLPQRINI